VIGISESTIGANHCTIRLFFVDLLQSTTILVGGLGRLVAAMVRIGDAVETPNWFSA
jgi:hypothetical protein